MFWFYQGGEMRSQKAGKQGALLVQKQIKQRVIMLPELFGVFGLRDQSLSAA
jgi:hypothetical protein